MEQTDFREQMYMFSTTFSDRFFPLYADRFIQDDQEDYECFTDKCPAEFQAFTHYDYDEITGSNDPAVIVLAYILANPWVDSDRPPLRRSGRPLPTEKSS